LQLFDDRIYEVLKHSTDDSGITLYYELIYLSSGNLNWYKAAYVAQDAGGYLTCINPQEVNDFVSC
jgi:hypothetical protein